jgi:hypothetical protein
MCITNIYTDQYPDGKQLEFRTTDRCQDRENGQPCTQFIEENPIRKIQFGEPTTEYMLTTNTPLSQSPTPSPARGTNGLFNPPPGPGSYRGRGNYRGGVGGHFQNLHWNASGAPARAGRGQHAENVTLRHTSLKNYIHQSQCLMRAPSSTVARLTQKILVLMASLYQQQTAGMEREYEHGNPSTPHSHHNKLDL